MLFIKNMSNMLFWFFLYTTETKQRFSTWNLSRQHNLRSEKNNIHQKVLRISADLLLLAKQDLISKQVLIPEQD